MTRNNRFLPLLLLAGDFLALFLFVYLGQRDHETLDAAHPILIALFNTMPFALPWLLAAWPLGALTPGRVRPLLARSLNAWLVAAPLALLLRAFVLGRATIPVPFLLVTLGLGGAFLLGWRLLFALWWQRPTQSPANNQSPITNH